MVERLAVRTAVSEEAQRNVEVTFGGTCEILPNGVDGQVFAEAEPWPAPTPTVVFVGRHEPRKGLGVLLDAWVGLERNAVLWVAGDGPQSAALRARNVAGVEWLGRISEAEKARRLRGATAACFPSIEGESFGIVLLEAMAARTPVVASDLIGYRNVARDGEEAVLVPPADASELRDALRRVLDDQGLRRELSAAGAERASTFSMASLAEAFVARYEAAIRAPRRGSRAARVRSRLGAG
jgi:phosphatidylinositol alpha-mannosyltransferase